MENNSFRFSIILISIVVTMLFSLFSSIFSFVCILSINRSNDHIFSKVPSLSYQYLHRNYEKNETDFGYVKFHRKIDHNDFISYEQDDNSHILISNFGEEEFECLGTCYCEGTERRIVTSSTVLRRGISYLLVSISSVIAYERAKSYFESKCIEKLSEECGYLESSIKSSVDECSSIVHQKEEEEEGERRVYFCYGHCVKNMKLRTGEAKEQFEHMKCENLKQEGEVILYESNLIGSSPSIRKVTKFVNTVANRFQEQYLVGFCKKNSKLSYEYGVTIIRNGKGYHYVRSRDGFGCVGRSSHIGKNGKRSQNRRNVKCRQIDPKPKV